jgi:hypothetical protein
MPDLSFLTLFPNSVDPGPSSLALQAPVLVAVMAVIGVVVRSSR